MLKCTITIPAENSHGQLFPPEINSAVRHELREEFEDVAECGIRVIYRGGGAHRAQMLYVYVNPTDVERLHDTVAKICSSLGVSIRFEKTLSNVEDIAPAARDCDSSTEAEAEAGAGAGAWALKNCLRPIPFAAQPQHVVLAHLAAARRECGEFGGELSHGEVARLKGLGCNVKVYRHKGTVSTVVRFDG